MPLLCGISCIDALSSTVLEAERKPSSRWLQCTEASEGREGLGAPHSSQPLEHAARYEPQPSARR